MRGRGRRRHLRGARREPGVGEEGAKLLGEEIVEEAIKEVADERNP